MVLSNTQIEKSRHAMLSEFALKLSDASDMEALTQEVGSELKYLIDFSRCTLARLNENGTSYNLLTLLETRPEVAEISHEDISLECGIAGKVIREGEICVLSTDDGKGNTEWRIADEAMEAGTFNSIICLPLQTGGRMLGAITFGTDLLVGYSQADISTASIIAMHLSLALDRWDMLEKLRTANEKVQKLNAELETRVRLRTDELVEQIQLSNLGAKIGSVLAYSRNLREMLQSCTDILVENLQVDLARIWRMDKSRGFLSMEASSGLYTHLDGKHGRLPAGKYKIGLIAREGKPHLTNDAASDLRVHDKKWLKQKGLVAFAGYPLIFENKVVGVMAIFSGHPFSKATFDSLISIADAIAVGISRAQTEEELRKAKEFLERRVEERTAELTESNELLAGKIEELESFSYSVSHDLRAPLRSIDGFSQAVLEDYSDKLDVVGKDYLNRVRVASQRMGYLIDDLLHLSRVSRQEMNRKKVDLSQMVESTIKELREKQSDRRVEFKVTPEIRVNGDINLLRIAVENLLENAWKYTAKHSSAKIEFGVTKYKDKEAFFVRDDGAGFDNKYVGKLFNPFQRLHKSEEFEGNGIGLATVQRIIQRHGGKVWAEGEVEKGATFFFTLS